MINSKEYWNNRFQSGNWDELGGEEQTLFFNTLAINNLPNWVVDDIESNNLSIVDIGCAEGSGTSLFKNKFSMSKVTGIDFSESAIAIASKKYPACEFKCQDIDEIVDKYDVVFSSNVLEHFKNPFEKIEKLTKISEKYIILLLPFQEDNLHEEHFIRFDYGSFMLGVNNFRLCYHKVINTKYFEDTKWPGKQILIIYVNNDYLDYDKLKLSKIVNGDFEEKEKLLNELRNLRHETNKINDELCSCNRELEIRDNLISNYKLELENDKKAFEEINYQVEVYKEEINNIKQQIQVCKEQLQEKEQAINNLNSDSKLLIEENTKNTNRVIELQELINDSTYNLKMLQNSISETKNNALMLADTKLFKLVHLIYRIKHQLIKGSINDKKRFFKWLRERRKLRAVAQEHTYNPLFQIIDRLDQLSVNYAKNLAELENSVTQSNNSVVKDNSVSNLNDNIINNQEDNHKLSLKLENYDYKKQDIIFFSVISWDFRYQRPQHLATQLSKLGHRVFYFNVDFKSDFEILKKDENLYIVNLDDFYGKRIYDVDFSISDHFKQQLTTILNDYNIRDCSIITEYPSWYHVCKYLKDDYKFKVIFDYIDDYEGFEDTTNSGLKSLTEKLFKLSDLTIATSNFLYEKTKSFCNNVKIVRNGTEFEFFNKAFIDVNKNKKKIGYYGAIAEWFDIEKVEYLAKNLPDVDIELIGNVSYEKCYKLSKYKNVKFLGEKGYNELINYLKDYDVCLIPFRSDIDLIRATNPVKFYEYLSAGKKVVATEIPELLPYKDKFVYLSNDNDEFLNYVKICINNEDNLASVDEKLHFAKSNDWQQRCLDLSRYIAETYDLVSIIIVTYNNIEYTKQCIDSILRKSAYPNYEIIIVDNASKDETPEYLLQLEKEFNNITVILNNENKGFAGGNNDGIRAAKGEYIILLNNDTLVTRGWINGLIKHIGVDDLGMVCPVTNSIGNEAQINVNYKDVKDMDKFAIEYTTKNYNKLYEDIDVLAMFCVAFSREVLNKVGLLDENYKVGMFEDDDYSTAVKKAGYRIACVEDVFIHHFGSVSFKKLEDKKYKSIFDNNKAYFEKKWNMKWTPHKYRSGVGGN